jgi:predicted DCC family thiol-disulfide oxidoreductase YuxK
VITVVYDADCGVCQASVKWLRQRDRHGVFQFVGNDAPALPPGVTLEETEHTVVVLDGGRKFTRGDAVAHLLRHLRGWSLPGAVMRAPGLRQLSNWGYDRFAANRHRISAALGMRACALPNARSSPAGKPEPTPTGAPSGTR